MGRESYRALALLLCVSVGPPAACEREPGSGATASGAASRTAPTVASGPGGAARAGADVGMGARARDDARRAAEQYLESGRVADAMVITARLVEIAPDGVLELELHARVLLAEALTGRGDARPAALDRAAEAYRRASAADPDNAGLAHAAGVAFDQAGRLDAALAFYEKAESLDGSNPQFALYSALALRRLDRADEALAALDRASALSPEAPSILVARAEVLLTLGRRDEALEQARRARALAPRDLGARVIESRSLRALDRNLEAAESLASLDAAARGDEAVATELAAALLAIGRPTDAARAWEESFAADPRRWTSALGAAEAWLAAGELIRAQARLEAASDLAPRAMRDDRIRPVEQRIRDASRERDQRSDRPPSTGK